MLAAHIPSLSTINQLPKPAPSSSHEMAPSSSSNNTINTTLNAPKLDIPARKPVALAGKPAIVAKTAPVPAQPATPASSKYPTIAIKPKPVPIAVLPKPSRPSTFKSTFDLNSRLSLKSEISLNINTSKKWVLPPRPRPGRKPTANQKSSPPPEVRLPSASSPKPSKICAKKRAKAVKKEEKPVGMAPSISNPPLVVKLEPEDTPMRKSATVDTMPTTVKIEPDLRPLAAPVAPNVTSHVKPFIPIKQQPLKPAKSSKDDMVYLQTTYLAKLKEQELIRNYIEVINNQIKELKFVQNGVISVDALNGDDTSTTAVPNKTAAEDLLPSSHEQLENINNMNDLNKFLNYLTKSTNIIHSVTKKFMTPKDEDESKVLDEQINYYLEIRSKYKLLKHQEVKSIEKLKRERQKLLKQNLEPPKPKSPPKPELSQLSILLSSVNSPDSPNGITNSTPSSFIPSLLRPLNSFGDMDDLNDMQFLNDSDGDFLNPTYLDDNTNLVNEEGVERTPDISSHDFYDNEMFTNLQEQKPEAEPEFEARPEPKVELKPTPKAEPKGKKKFNCGFCTNDTPCLCLDAEGF